MAAGGEPVIDLATMPMGRQSDSFSDGLRALVAELHPDMGVAPPEWTAEQRWRVMAALRNALPAYESAAHRASVFRDRLRSL
jgi:hypothetical protein